MMHQGKEQTQNTNSWDPGNMKANTGEGQKE